MPRFTTNELLAIAEDVGAQADRLRAVSAQITIAVATTRWRSAAAAAFRDRTHGTALGLRAGADRLDGAAELVRRHAARVADAAALEVGSR